MMFDGNKGYWSTNFKKERSEAREQAGKRQKGMGQGGIVREREIISQTE
jgi:hypothetical protein